MLSTNLMVFPAAESIAWVLKISSGFFYAGIILLAYAGSITACLVAPFLKGGLQCICGLFCDLQARRTRAHAVIIIGAPNPIHEQIIMPGGTGAGGMMFNPMLRAGSGEP